MFTPTLTDEQVDELIQQYSSLRQIRKAGYPLGAHRFNRRRAALARKGTIPEWGMTDNYADGLALRKVTVHKRYVEGVGEVVNTWERACEETEEQQQRLEAVAEAFYKALPNIPVQRFTRKDYNTDMVPWVQIGDGHIGMLARESEVGHEFNLETAERDLCVAVATLIDELPVCERCVIQDLGDMTHYENLAGVTEASRHQLDCDPMGYSDMLDVYIRTMRFIVERALGKFKYVDVIINQGNHSRKNDIWMAKLLRAAYASDRLHVLDNRGVFIPYRMGNTFVLSTHTDQCKPTSAAGVMANKYAQDWGETKYHYIDGGHVHHRQTAKELNGAVYESWNQIALGDKYAHDHGYDSRSCLTVVLRSKTYGEEGRRTISLERVRDIIHNAAPGTTAQKRQHVYTV